MKFITIVIFMMLFLNIYTFEIENELKMNNKQEYYKLDSILNPEGRLDEYIEDGLKSNINLDYKFNMYINKFSLKLHYGTDTLLNKNEKTRSKFKELYFSYELFGNFLDIGKKKVTSTVSFMKNPIDFIINSNRDITSDTKSDLEKKEGKVMINYEFYSKFGVLSLSYLPNITFENKKINDFYSSDQKEELELRYGFQISNFDVTFITNKSNIYRNGANFSAVFGNNIEVHSEVSYIENIQTKSINEDLIISSKENKNIVKGILGGTLSFDEINILFEFYYNGNGINRKELKKVISAIKKFDNEFDEFLNQDSTKTTLQIIDNRNLNYMNIINDSNYEELVEGIEKYNKNLENYGKLLAFFSSFDRMELAKYYGMFRLYNSDSEKWDLSLSSIYSFVDLSGINFISLKYIGLEDFEFALNPYFTTGNDLSEFRITGLKKGISFEIKYNIF